MVVESSSSPSPTTTTKKKKKKKKTSTTTTTSGTTKPKSNRISSSKDGGSVKKKKKKSLPPPPPPTSPPKRRVSSTRRTDNGHEHRRGDHDDDDDDDAHDNSSRSSERQAEKVDAVSPPPPQPQSTAATSSPTTSGPLLETPLSPTSPSSSPTSGGRGTGPGGRGRGRGPGGRGRGPGRGSGRGRGGRGGRGRGRGRGRSPNHAAGNDWLHYKAGGKMTMAPVPSNWTTASGHFKPQESELGFDASSAVGPNGLTKSSRKGRSSSTKMLGLSDSHHSIGNKNALQEPTVEIQVEIEDPKEREAFYEGLQKIGIEETIDVDDDHSDKNPVSVISLGYASYILDLAQQREMRENDRQEEALEETLELYKTALSEGAKDDEQLFLAILNEVKKEMDVKYVDIYKQKDQWLDDALQAELDRRAALKDEPKEEVHKPKQKAPREEKSTSPATDVGKRATRVDEIMEYEGWDGYDGDEGWDEYEDYYEDIHDDVGDDDLGGDFIQPAKSNAKSSAPTNKKTKSGGGGGCCGRAVEDSVVDTSTPGPMSSTKDPSQGNYTALFKRLKKKKEEELKKQRDEELLAEEDMWWKNEPVEVNVPEIEDDAPLPLLARAGSFLGGLVRNNSGIDRSFSGRGSRSSGIERSLSGRGSHSSSMERSLSDRGSRSNSLVGQREVKSTSRLGSRHSKESRTSSNASSIAMSIDSETMEDEKPTRKESVSSGTDSSLPCEENPSEISKPVSKRNKKSNDHPEDPGGKPRSTLKKKKQSKKKGDASAPPASDGPVEFSESSAGKTPKSTKTKKKKKSKVKVKASMDSGDAEDISGSDKPSSRKGESTKKKKADSVKKTKRQSS
mmetsp:Transcript_54715/g.132860  ORF Transcript_54715/g.132860 Transcript_54715/m.132860 type:complete len:845 (+) Transcript_54715:173-2707(+)